MTVEVTMSTQGNDAPVDPGTYDLELIFVVTTMETEGYIAPDGLHTYNVTRPITLMVKAASVAANS